MDKTLSELLTKLTSINHPKFARVELLDGKLLFHYLGGKFFIIKSITTSSPDIAYLKVYHETPLVEGNKKPVENFYLKVDKYGHLSITNYIKNQMTQLLQTLTQSDTVTVLADEVSIAFAKQFDAKMSNEDFELNPE